MSDLHRKIKSGHGWRRVVRPGEMQYLELAVLRLKRGEEEQVRSRGRETAIVMTSGGCNAWIDGADSSLPMGRRNVFDDLPWAIYLPDTHRVHFRAMRVTELIVASAPSEKKSLDVRVISPYDIKERRRGRGNFRRTIRNLIVSEDQTEHISFGETINPPGNWSSYPPHKHDAHNPPDEYPLEEIYLYKFHPDQGFGFQRAYTRDRKFDETYLIEHNQVVMLKKGYHPVVAAGGYRLYYFWILAGRRPRLSFADDPAHAWVKDVKW